MLSVKVSSETCVSIIRFKPFPTAGAINSSLLSLNRDLVARMIYALGWNPIELALSCKTRLTSPLRNLTASPVGFKGGSVNLKRG